MFKFQYNPARHNGEVNRAGLTFKYLAFNDDHFKNTPTGQTRRFRWDRMVKAINIINTAQAMHGGRI